MNEREKANVAAGKCRCGEERKGDNVSCAGCCERFKRNFYAYRERNLKAWNERMRKYNKATRDKLRESKKCIRCGSETCGHTRCEDCLAKIREWMRAKREAGRA